MRLFSAQYKLHREDLLSLTSPAGCARGRSFLAEGFIGEEVINEELLARERFLGAGDITAPVSSGSSCIARRLKWRRLADLRININVYVYPGPLRKPRGKPAVTYPTHKSTLAVKYVVKISTYLHGKR